MRSSIRLAGTKSAAICFLAVVVLVLWINQNKSGEPPGLRVLVIHRRLPRLGTGCDARLVSLLGDLVQAGGDVHYLAVEAANLKLSEETTRSGSNSKLHCNRCADLSLGSFRALPYLQAL